MKKKSKPLKRSKTGIELEVQTLNEKGFITNKADFLIKECQKQNKDISFSCDLIRPINSQNL